MASARLASAVATRSMAAEPVGYQRIDDVGHMAHQAAVARCQRRDGRCGVAHPGQAGQVLVQVTVGRADDHGRSVHDVVTREQERPLLDEPAQVIRGMARRVQGTQREVAARVAAGAAQGPALAGALVGREALGRAEADDPGPGGGGQGGGARGVVDVGVGHHDGVDGPERCGGGQDGGGVRIVGRAGVDHHRVDLAHQVGVGAGARHEAGVGGGQPEHARRHLVDPARLGGRTKAEVGHGRDGRDGRWRLWAHPVGRGPGALSGPSTFARMETARTASLKSARASLPPGSATGARS